MRHDLLGLASGCMHSQHWGKGMGRASAEVHVIQRMLWLNEAVA